MKKLITMMLVLLIVGGAVFAVDGGVLTLKSSVTAFTGHGFFPVTAAVSDTADFDDVKNVVDGVTGGSYENETLLIDLESDTLVDVARYYFASNSPKTGYDIEFVVNPFKLFDTDDTNVLFTVPLTLNVTEEVSHENVTVFEGNISASGNLGTTINPSTQTLVASTATLLNGPKYVGLVLKAKSTGPANLAYGIPSGNYVATVVAYVITK